MRRINQGGHERSAAPSASRRRRWYVLRCIPLGFEGKRIGETARAAQSDPNALSAAQRPLIALFPLAPIRETVAMTTREDVGPVKNGDASATAAGRTQKPCPFSTVRTRGTNKLYWIVCLLPLVRGVAPLPIRQDNRVGGRMTFGWMPQRRQVGSNEARTTILVEDALDAPSSVRQCSGTHPLCSFRFDSYPPFSSPHTEIISELSYR
jgi:hypothetical protein